MDAFVAATGAGMDQALHYLELAAGDLENAVHLFMEMGPVVLAGVSASTRCA